MEGRVAQEVRHLMCCASENWIERDPIKTTPITEGEIEQIEKFPMSELIEQYRIRLHAIEHLRSYSFYDLNMLRLLESEMETRGESIVREQRWVGSFYNYGDPYEKGVSISSRYKLENFSLMAWSIIRRQSVEESVGMLRKEPNGTVKMTTDPEGDNWTMDELSRIVEFMKVMNAFKTPERLKESRNG